MKRKEKSLADTAIMVMKETRKQTLKDVLDLIKKKEKELNVDIIPIKYLESWLEKEIGD